uniref:Uncharacterized protein n=1 Tax=Chenopodium quinoa TaxID=63459 RepID=A0A803KVU8_CHEQI
MESIFAPTLTQATFLSPLSPPSNDVSSIPNLSHFSFSARNFAAPFSLKVQKQLAIAHSNGRAINSAKCNATLSDTLRKMRLFSKVYNLE